MEDIKTVLWRQAGASIDMLENAIKTCPETLWDGPGQYWYVAYHTIFYLDYYASQDPAGFSPPEPYTFSEFDAEGALPPRTYSQAELLSYLGHCRRKYREYILNLDAEKRFVNEYRNISQLEMAIYNLRHVQHHAAQLNMLLRQNGVQPPGWVAASG